MNKTNLLRISLRLIIWLTVPLTPLFGQRQPFNVLEFGSLAPVWDEAMPLGNGMLGALVWQKENKLRISLDRADLWDLRPLKGLHRPEFKYAWIKEQVDRNNYELVQKYFDAPYEVEPAPTKISGGALEFET